MAKENHFQTLIDKNQLYIKNYEDEKMSSLPASARIWRFKVGEEYLNVLCKITTNDFCIEDDSGAVTNSEDVRYFDRHGYRRSIKYISGGGLGNYLLQGAQGKNIAVYYEGEKLIFSIETNNQSQCVEFKELCDHRKIPQEKLEEFESEKGRLEEESRERMLVSGSGVEPMAFDFFANDNFTPAEGVVDWRHNINPQEYIQREKSILRDHVINYMHSVGKILNSNGIVLGTGFLIHRQAILVSKHSILDAIGDEGGIIEQLHFSIPGKDKIIINIINGCLEDGAKSEQSDKNFDYVILRLESPIEATPLTLVPSTASDSDKQPYGTIWTLHYPENAHFAQCLSIGESSSSEYFQLQANYALHTSLCSSGCPSINSRGQVLALHTSCINLQGFRRGELLQTIYETNADTLLAKLSNGEEIDINKIVEISALMPPIRADETLEGIFHDNGELFHVGRHIGGRVIIEAAEDMAKVLTKEEVKDATFTTDTNRQLVAEYNFAHPGNTMPLKSNHTQGVRLDDAYLDRCHRISAEDIQKNICRLSNRKEIENLKAFANLVHQAGTTVRQSDAGYESSIEYINGIFQCKQAKDFDDMTKAARLLYKRMFDAKYNLSFGHKGTNSGIGQQLDLNFSYNSSTSKYALTPRSRRICEESKNFQLTPPKFENGRIYSSHVIDGNAPTEHDFKNPNKINHRSIAWTEIDGISKKILKEAFNIGADKKRPASGSGESGKIARH